MRYSGLTGAYSGPYKQQPPAPREQVGFSLIKQTDNTITQSWVDLVQASRAFVEADWRWARSPRLV